MSTTPDPQAHRAELVRAARARIGSRFAGMIDASSIVQDVYLDLCEKEQAVDLPELRVRVRHKVIDAVRKLNAMKRGGRPPERLDQATDPPADGPTPSQEAFRREILALLDGPSELTPTEAAVVRAHYFEGQSYRQIAAALGLPLGSVGFHLASGLEKLRGRDGALS